MRSLKFVLILTIAAIALTACQPSAPATVDPNIVQATVNALSTQAMETIAAQATQTALAIPTNTPQPTSTPTEVPTATLAATATATLPPPPTAVPTRAITNTPVYTATTAPYACVITSQSPASGATLKINEDFDMKWTIKNTGTKIWLLGNVDLTYTDGQKMQKYTDGVDLPKETDPTEEVTFVVDMKAPDKAGTYTATWKLLEAGTNICTLSVNIKVVE